VSRAAGIDQAAPLLSETNRLIFASYQRMILFFALAGIDILLTFIFLPHLLHDDSNRLNTLFILVAVGTAGSFLSAPHRPYNFKKMPPVRNSRLRNLPYRAAARQRTLNNQERREPRRLRTN
jgi:hypothetical protein